jgi:CPA2 family monovalent cation:H+ antiporter-2
MAAQFEPATYKELILFLATAGIVVPLFHRLRISPVLGFLGAGALLGPYGLGRLAEALPWLSWVTIANREETSHIAEFGVVFLLFTIGIELSFQRLRILRRMVFGLGSLQVVACAAAIGGIAFAVTRDVASAALIGFALALSSTAIVIPVLADQKRLNAPAGRASFSVLLFQDLAVAPVLFAIAALGQGNATNLVGSFAIALFQAILAIAVILVVGRLGLRPLFHLVAATGSSEFFMAACLLVVLGTGLVAGVSGLSMALGAFIAGLLLAETEYRRAIEASLAPFRGLLLGVFFVTVGMGLDPLRLVHQPVAILSAALALIGVKAGIVFALGRLFGLSSAVASETALLLGAGGEFAFVILGATVAAGFGDPVLIQSLLLVTTITMIATPGLARIGRLLGGRLEHRLPEEPAALVPPPADDVGRVIVAGFGRVGQLVAEMLERHAVPYLGIDTDPGRVTAARLLGKPVFYGDAARPEFLRACGIERARGLVVTLDAPSVTEAVVGAGRGERPDLTIVARARDARHASRLYELGVDDAVPETIEASLQLSEAVLVDLGVPMGHVIASIHERRDEFRALLRASETQPGRRGDERARFRARRTAGKTRLHGDRGA